MNKALRKINNEIRALAIPNVISNVSVPLISSVDTFLMGQLSALSLAAVGAGSMVFNFLYWNMGFLRMGTTGLTAQAFGRNDKHEIAAVLIKAGVLSVLISALLLVFQVPLFDLSCEAMSLSGSQVEEVWDYFSVRIIAAPASLLLMALMGWLFGMQNARYPLWITLFINLINIGASFYFVRQLNLGVRGAALGTLIAQYLGVILCLFMIAFRYGSFFDKTVFYLENVKSKFTDLLHLNKDIFIRTLFLSTAFLLLFRFSREAGPDFLAINVVFLQFLNWMSYAIDGFAFAAESLVGKYKGARDAYRLDLSVTWNMRWAFLFAVLFAASYGLFTEEIFSLFVGADEAGLLEKARPYFIWMTLLPLVGFASYIWDGIYVGLTASVSMRNGMFFAFFVYIGSYLLLPADLENHRIWLAFFLFLIARAAVLWFIYNKKGWERIR